MAEEKTGQAGTLSPPYVSYRTLRNYLGALSVSGLPNRIDRSVLGNLSGLVQSQLLAAMRFLDLINQDGIPTARLTELVGAEESERDDVLTTILQNAYPFMFGTFKLAGATPGQVRERFEAQGVSGDTVRKSVAFFLAAAKDAGIPLPPHLTTKRGNRSGMTRRRSQRENNGGSVATVATNGGVLHAPTESDTTTPAWAELLLSKFPSFDPAWPDEVKSKWFDAFDRLMKQGGTS